MILAPSILSADFARLVEAGADVLVAGSAVFGQGDPEASTRRLIEACA